MDQMRNLLSAAVLLALAIPAHTNEVRIPYSVSCTIIANDDGENSRETFKLDFPKLDNRVPVGRYAMPYAGDVAYWMGHMDRQGVFRLTSGDFFPGSTIVVSSIKYGNFDDIGDMVVLLNGKKISHGTCIWPDLRPRSDWRRSATTMGRAERLVGNPAASADVAPNLPVGLSAGGECLCRSCRTARGRSAWA